MNNKILPNLENRTVQQLPVKLIYADNDFNVFDKGTTEFYGEYDEFISDQPIEDKVIWNIELKDKDLKKLPVVFSCKLGLVLDEVFYTAYHKKKMRQALQSPAHEASLIDRLVDSMKTQGQVKLNNKIVEIICDKDNYKEATGWEELDPDFFVIDSQDKAIAFLLKLKQVYDDMNEISTKYNKGYQRPGSQEWHDVKTNCETTKSKVLTITPDIMNGLEIYFLADVNRDGNLNPYFLFKKVIVKKLKNNVVATIHDEKSVVYRIINDEGIDQEKTLASGITKFAWNMEVVGGMIPFTNSWALVKRAEA